MKLWSAVALCIVLPWAGAQTPGTWVLGQSTLAYHMTHPLHQVDGVSHAAKGKGVCQAGFCDFLIAVPVKTFDSGDTNRDLHMVQVTRGTQFPVVTVRFRIPEAQVTAPRFACDLEVQFAGNTAHYAQVPFEQTISGQDHHITGLIPSTLTDFKIDAPSFLTVPVRNEIPVRVDTTWRPS